MDGIDWMTVAEIVPITAAIALLGLLGAVSALPTLIVALALAGAHARLCAVQPAGGATVPRRRRQPADRPVARPGCCCAWPANGYLAAAIMLPLYYIADATLTLGAPRSPRRAVSGRRTASHFYQRALDGGFTVAEIVGARVRW